MSQRQIAKAVGVSQKQVWRDLGDAKGVENDAKGVGPKGTATPKQAKQDDKSYGLTEQSRIRDNGRTMANLIRGIPLISARRLSRIQDN